MSGRICFDITDIVKYAEGNDRVTGIQRVQFNLIAHLVRAHGGERIRCVFHHARLGSVVDVDPTRLFDSDEFDSACLLQQLGLERPRRLLPSRSKLKRFLSRYREHKLRRTLRKLDVCISALLLPKRLETMGLHRQQRFPPRVPMLRIDALPAGDHYVQTSANVTSAPMVAFARAHAARGGDVVQIVYDLIPEVRPEFFMPAAVRDYRDWLAEVVSLAPRAICISEWTAADLRRHLGVRSSAWDIRAIPLAHEFEGFARAARIPRPAIAGRWLPDLPFVLCVGTLEVRKNGLALLRAWRLLLGHRGDSVPLLIFAGKRGWLMQEFLDELASDTSLADSVRLIESPSDAELAWLYGQCRFTVYPSLYEGWGLPVGESAWFGKYCVASRATSIPEVCGELIDYVDPEDPDDIARGIARALDVPDLLSTREQGIRTAPLRRWSDVADDVHRIVIDSNPSFAMRRREAVSA